MRKITWSALLAGVTMIALPAMAQAAGTASAASAGIPSSVFWIGGIAAFLGFFIGSIPPNRGEMAGWEWDSRGALSWAVSMAGICGGATLYFSTASMVGVGAAVFGIFVALLRLGLTRPPRVPTGAPLEAGINRAQGDSPAAKFKAAERAYKKASFQQGSGGYYATRSPRDFRYGNSGMPAADLSMLGEALSGANSSTFDILLLLVRELPGESNQPGVIVVRGASALRQVKVENDGFVIDGQPKILAATIAGAVGYAWR